MVFKNMHEHRSKPKLNFFFCNLPLDYLCPEFGDGCPLLTPNLSSKFGNWKFRRRIRRIVADGSFRERHVTRSHRALPPILKHAKARQNICTLSTVDLLTLIFILGPHTLPPATTAASPLQRGM